MKDELIEDSRFIQFKKEAIITTVFIAVYILGLTAISAYFGKGNVSDYTYLLGMPRWFTLALLFQIFAMVVACVLITRVFPDVSLEADDPKYNYEEEK